LPETAVLVGDAPAVVDLAAEPAVASAGAAVLIGPAAAIEVVVVVDLHAGTAILRAEIAAAIRGAAAPGVDRIATNPLDSGIARQLDALATVAAAVGLRGAKSARGGAHAEILHALVAAAVRAADAARVHRQATEPQAARVT
jgi:hypothetical protein